MRMTNLQGIRVHDDDVRATGVNVRVSLGVCQAGLRNLAVGARRPSNQRRYAMQVDDHAGLTIKMTANLSERS